MEASNLGKWLIVIGVCIALSGILVIFSPKIPFLGKLPGDILVKKEGFTFYFPLASSILLSLLLSLVLYLLGKLGR